MHYPDAEISSNDELYKDLIKELEDTMNDKITEVTDYITILRIDLLKGKENTSNPMAMRSNLLCSNHYAKLIDNIVSIFNDILSRVLDNNESTIAAKELCDNYNFKIGEIDEHLFQFETMINISPQLKGELLTFISPLKLLMNKYYTEFIAVCADIQGDVSYCIKELPNACQKVNDFSNKWKKDCENVSARMKDGESSFDDIINNIDDIMVRIGKLKSDCKDFYSFLSYLNVRQMNICYNCIKYGDKIVAEMKEMDEYCLLTWEKDGLLGHITNQYEKILNQEEEETAGTNSVDEKEESCSVDGKEESCSADGKEESYQIIMPPSQEPSSQDPSALVTKKSKSLEDDFVSLPLDADKGNNSETNQEEEKSAETNSVDKTEKEFDLTTMPSIQEPNVLVHRKPKSLEEDNFASLSLDSDKENRSESKSKSKSTCVLQ